jgi:hypothetical protein
MKRILEIIKRVDNDSIGLFLLKEEEDPIRKIDVFITPERNSWLRTGRVIMEKIKSEDYRKVVAFSIDATPVISLKSFDVHYLRESIKNGFLFLEVECREDGYPELKDGQLIIYKQLSYLVPNITPAEALERIKQLNENFTNNHKLTPGLHESS